MKFSFFFFFLLFFTVKNNAQNQVTIKPGYEFFRLIDKNLTGRGKFSFNPHYAFGLGTEINRVLKNQRQKLVLDIGLVQRSFYYEENYTFLGGKDIIKGDFNVTLLRVSPRFDFFITKELSIGAGLAGTYALFPRIQGISINGTNTSLDTSDLIYEDAFGTRFGGSTAFSLKYTLGKFNVQLIHYTNFLVSKTVALNFAYLIFNKKK